MHRPHYRLRAALGVLVAMATAGAPAREVTGQFDLVAGRGQAVSPLEVVAGVVYFLPEGPPTPPRPGRYSIDTHSKGFQPATLVVPAGSLVAFPNRDRVLHNVQSRSPAHAFDLGVYGPGDVRETRFAQPGLVQVHCSVHPGMRATVLVMGTPHYARPQPDGSFRIDGLPDGSGTLVFWHPRANPVTRTVAAAGDVATGRVTLRAVRAPVASTVRP